MILENQDLEHGEFAGIRQTLKEYGVPNIDNIKNGATLVQLYNIFYRTDPKFRELQARRYKAWYDRKRATDGEWREQKKAAGRMRYVELKKDSEAYAENLRKQREARARRMADPEYSERHHMDQEIRYQRRKLRSQFPDLSDEEIESMAREAYERIQKRKAEVRAEREQLDARRREREAKRSMIQQMADSMASGNA